MSERFTKDMTFHQAMQTSQQVVGVLRKYNLGCVGCMGAMNETLEQGAMAHGLDINDLLRDLNAIEEE
ncbi:MAG: disulfide oxidoreductase [Desulfuromonas sp.]|nr:MAG: disulfide oxidoreductase [Desulfuromonas sp.]